MATARLLEAVAGSRLDPRLAVNKMRFMNTPFRVGNKRWVRLVRTLSGIILIPVAAHAVATVETVGPDPATYGRVESVSIDGGAFLSTYGPNTPGLRYRWTPGGAVPITAPTKVSSDFASHSAWGQPRGVVRAVAPDVSGFIAQFYSRELSAGNLSPLASYTLNGGDYYLWTATNNWQQLSFLASGMSSTGRIIGRRAFSVGGQPRTAGVYADADLITHDLPRVNEANTCQPDFISADGQVIVGREVPAGGGAPAYIRWVAGQPTQINAFGAPTADMFIMGTSADLMTLVGSRNNRDSRLPIRWRDGFPPQTLATLASSPVFPRGGLLWATTADGNLCIGTSDGATGSVDMFVPGRYAYALPSDGLVIWNRAGACRPLEGLLFDEGLDVRGMFEVVSPFRISSVGGLVTVYAAGWDSTNRTTVSCKKIVFPDPNQGAPVPLAGGAMLDPTPAFVPTIRVSETYSESTLPAPYPTGFTRTSRGKSSFTIIASMAGINLATLDPNTPFSFRVGDWVFSGKLGDDPKYLPGKTSAKFAFTKLVNGKNVTIASIGLKWSATSLTATGGVTDPTFQSIARKRYEKWEGPVSGWIPVQIGFAGQSGKRNAVWLTGQNTMTMRPVAADLGQGYLQPAYLRVPGLSLTGSTSTPAAF